MAVKPTPPAPPAPPAPTFPILPIVRHALIIHTPGAPSVEVIVREMRDKVRLSLDMRSVDLTLAEAQTLAEHLRKIAYRVSHRPKGRP